MRKILVTLTLLLLTSCSGLSEGIASARVLFGELKEDYQSMKEGFNEGVEVLGDLKEELKEAQAEFSAMKADAFKKADKDGDGDLDWMEKIAYWVMLGGGLGEIARRKLKGLQSGIDRLHVRVDGERGKRKDLAHEVRKNAQAS